MRGRDFARAQSQGFKTPRARKRGLRQYESNEIRTAKKLRSVEREKDADDELKLAQ